MGDSKQAADLQDLFEKLLINMRKPRKLQSCCESGIEDLKSSYQGQELMGMSEHTVRIPNRQQYQVVSHCGVTVRPWDMCLITPNKVAMTVDKLRNIHEVQFITVTQSQLVLGRKFQLQHGCIVYKCAVSPTGDKLYIINYWQHKLLILARDGTLLATFTDQELRGREGVHVTPAGQVLVCGGLSHTILQVDWEGRNKLAILATGRDGVVYP
ncbi:hypothetical protein DPMN_017203 [Dreissena polymorpha]|uniref:Uncharacterized protein n=1 Tax=Dreissena polymorpha TaxID=45954 RepID=A0A9D4NEF1_DREPO|nr:hypothetical protein DPMN_017203 [Dreissena polymorpha]